MFQPLLFATLAAIGNAVFVYGQRAANPPTNPFLFTCYAVGVCFLFFAVASLMFKSPKDVGYLSENWIMIAVSGFGFFLTFVGFFLLYNKFGASQYALYAVISILTTSIVVGVIIFRESFNGYQMTAVGLAILSIVLFTYGKAQNV